MPYKSDAQRKFFHTDTAKKAGITGAEVKEFDTASKGKELPEHTKKMADGGVTSGNPSELDKPVQDVTVSDFLLPYLLAPSSAKAVGEIPSALEGLGETGAVRLGKDEGESLAVKAASRLAPKMEEDVTGATTRDVVAPQVGDTVPLRSSTPGMPELQVKYNGPMMKDSPGLSPELRKMAQEPMFNLDKDIPAHAGDVMHPTDSTVAKSTLEARGYKFPDSYAKGGPVLRSSLEHQVPNGMMARVMSGGGYAEGGYPRVTFLENESPAEVKKATHMEGRKAGPMDATETGEKTNPPHMAEGGTIHKAEDRNKEPSKPANVDMSHEDKLKSIYKTLGMKKYADGGTVLPDAPAIDPNAPPAQNDPSYWDQIKAALSQVGAPMAGAANALTAPLQGAATMAAPLAPAAVSAVNSLTGASLPVPHVPVSETANISAPAAPVAPPPVPMAASTPSAATGNTPENPALKNLFNQDTSAIEKGATAGDRQALVNQLQTQQHGIGNVIAQALSGLGDALAAKGGREQHSLQGIFSMQKEQRDEALANFDKARQDRLQKLDIQTKMGQNAIQKLAAQDAYGTDDNLNTMLGAPKGTAHKDLPLYFQARAAQVAQQEKDGDLYMKAHAQAASEVDSAVKNASMLNMKPSSAQLEASGAKLADQYYNKAKGNILFQPSDGQKAVWIPAVNMNKAKQMDPHGQIIP